MGSYFDSWEDVQGAIYIGAGTSWEVIWGLVAIGLFIFSLIVSSAREANDHAEIDRTSQD